MVLLVKMRVCRLCLYEGDEKQVLSIWNSNVEDLATKIKNCVSINVTRNDGLPGSACLSCIHLVNQWVVFNDTCQKSNEILLKKISERKSSDLKPLVYNNSQYFTEQLEDENIAAGFKCEDNSNNKNNFKPPKVDYRSEYSSDESDSDNEKISDNEYLEDYYEDLEIKTKINNVYKCDVCAQEFTDCFEYLDHQEVHNGQSVFQCDKCTEIYDCRKDLVEHDKHHRNPCPQCGKLILKNSMKLHLIKHTDKYKCTQCLGHFNSRAALAQHIITVHTDIKNHICETCGKRFSSQTAMRVHMKSHSDERLYPCKICNYAGRTASAIYVHMSTHANDLCVCEVCSKTFKSTRNLNDHLRRVHSKVKKHQCTYCDKKFVDKYMLSVHIRCHTGVRPYQCKLCEKAFIRSDGLKEHMATHGERIMYDCRDCGKKFTSKRGVARHTCAPLI